MVELVNEDMFHNVGNYVIILGTLLRLTNVLSMGVQV
jgi:hypothetical protein